MVAAMEAAAVKPARLFWISMAIESDVAGHVYATPDRSRYVRL